MEDESAIYNNSKKRDRDDSVELCSTRPDSKRVNSVVFSDVDQLGCERVDLEIVSDSAESDVCDPNSPVGGFDGVVDFPGDILDILDDADDMPVGQDLDSVIRSFEEEIRQTSPSSDQMPADELTYASSEYQTDLGYLLEASDDELGLPPTVSSAADPANGEPGGDVLRAHDEDDVLGGMAEFGAELPSYDSFELGLSEGAADGENGDCGFVMVDGLFDFSEPSDFWRPESLPAL